MNLDYLNTYLHVVKLGSFSKASKKLNISQPAVSFQIKRLEKESGIQLLDRRKRTIKMTEAGKRLYRFAEYAIREQANVFHDIEQLREEVTGELIIAVSSIPGEFILPAILSKFKEYYPVVEIKLIMSNSLKIVTDVQKGIYDIGFCSLGPEETPELESIKIAEDEIVLVVYPEHPFARRQKVSLSELAGESFILREEAIEKHRSAASLLFQAGFDISQCKPKLVLGTNMGVVSAVEARAGIAFLSSLVVNKSSALGWVKVVKVDGLNIKRDFFCVYRKEKSVSRLHKEFMNFIREKWSL